VLVNTLAINRGLMPKVLRDETAQKAGGQPFELDKEYLKEIRGLMPDLFTGVSEDDANYIDVFAIASKAQRTANRVFMAEYEANKQDTLTAYKGFLKKRSDVLLTDINPGENDIFSNLGNWLNSKFMLGSDYYKTKSETPDGKASQTELDPRIDSSSKENSQVKEPPAGFAEYFNAEFRQGSQFAIFKVDNTGSVTESFSNVSVESQISSTLNGTASSIRDIRFSLADGNLLSSTITDMAKSVTGAIGDMVSGGLSSVTFGVSNFLMGLASAGYIDIPKHWQNSNARLPSGSYKIKLISPYGNVMSQMQNIYIPLCMLLAGTLPMSVGRAAYGSPMICQLYDRGRCQIKLGMIESLTITRGTSNLPFNTKGTALALDVSFTVVDLSSIMHMPLTASGIFGSTVEMTLDEDNILHDYLAVLAGQDLYSQFFSFPKAKLRMAKEMLRLNRLTSSAEWASIIHDTTTSGSLSWTLVGNILEGIVGNSSILSGATDATRV